MNVRWESVSSITGSEMMSSSSSSSPPPPLSICLYHFNSRLQSRPACWTGIDWTRRTRSTAKVRRLAIWRLNRPPSLALCTINDDNITASEAHSPMEPRGAKNEEGPAQFLSSTKILKRLRRYGISGILSYGILNTFYYLMAFLVVWFYVAPAPGSMGFLAAAKRFLKIMAMVWAGSQVTKLLRAGGALALAPFVDRGLIWFTAKFKFDSQAKAFMAVVGFCFGLALILFLSVILLWS